MKSIKQALLIAGIMSLAGMSQAGLSVRWYVGYGMYPHGAADITSGTPGTGVAAVNSVIWQLVYAGSDNIANAVNLANSGTGWNGGDDIVLASRTTPAGGDASFDEWLFNANPGSLSPTENASYTSGFVFVRVFQSAAPAGGEWYYNSPTLALQNIDLTDPSRVAQNLDANPLSGDAQGNALNQQIAVVPEPSTIMFAALGLGLVAIRRVRKQS